MKIGIVTACDFGRCKVRVKFADHDQVISYWLPVIQKKTLRDKQYWMPDPGEHVACLMDEHAEFGVVLGAIYSDPDPVPVASQDKYHVLFDDRATIEYDRKEHVLEVYTPGKIKVRADGDIEVKAGGDILAEAAGNAEVKAAGDVAIRAGGYAEIRAGAGAQMVCGGPVLIKSGTRLTLKGPISEVVL